MSQRSSQDSLRRLTLVEVHQVGGDIIRRRIRRRERCVDGCRDLGQVMILSLEMDLLQDLDGSASSQITHAMLTSGGSDSRETRVPGIAPDL